MASSETTDPAETQDGLSDESSDATRSMSDVGDGIGDLGLSSDPDAQATVNDFADFTEHLPSDMARSLALIRDLDQRYKEASARTHELTKLYGALPSLPQEKRVDPAQLRTDITQSMNDAKQARLESYAEARRMQQNVGRHYDLAKSIHSKLQTIASALPPSGGASPSRPQSSSETVLATRTLPSFGDASPSRPQSSPRAVLAPKPLPSFGDASQSRPQFFPQAVSAPKTLPFSRDASTSRPQSSSPQLVRTSEILRPVLAPKPLGNARSPIVGSHYMLSRPFIIVPGDILDPNEVGYNVFSSESDESDSDSDTEEDPARSILTSRRGKTIAGRKPTRRPNPSKPNPPKPNPSKPSRTPQVTVPKPLGAPQPPRAMGTNVRSSVAGISTSDALRECTPPPEGTLPGDPIHAPWFELSKYELAVLRKKMKKNAAWSPSDTMISRELKLLGRGPDGFLKNLNKPKATLKPTGDQLPTTVHDASGRQAVTGGAINMSLQTDYDKWNNQGMWLNEAKKLRGENQAKGLAKLAADEAEESAHKLSNVANVIAGLFANPSTKSGANENTKTVESTRKRQREYNADTDHTKPVVETSPRLVIKPQRKWKAEIPVPAPQPAVSNTLNTMPARNIFGGSPMLSEAFSVSTGTSTSATSLGPSAFKKSSNTPILPPTKEMKKEPNESLGPSAFKKSSNTPILPSTKEIKKEPNEDVKMPALSMTAGPAYAAQPPFPPPQYLRPSSMRGEALPQTRRPSSLAEGPSDPRYPSRVGLRQTSRGRAAGVELAPTIARDRPRRSITAYNTPASEPYPTRAAARRTERLGPPPAAASVEKTTAAPRKKAGSKKQLKREGSDDEEAWYDVDDDDDDDDDAVAERLYCLCKRVSFGMMICCENEDVSLSIGILDSV